MKNGLLIWNVLLTILTGYLLIMHFSGNKGQAALSGSKGSDSSLASGPFRMAYFEMDSVESNFGMVKDVKSELSKREDDINNELERLGKNIQQKYNFYQTQAEQGALNQSQSESAAQELKSLDEQMKSRKQTLDQQYSDYAMKRTKDIKTAIEKFVKEYNKDGKYSYIIAEEPGFFYFKDSTFNITSEVIKGLNSEYKPGSTKD